MLILVFVLANAASAGQGAIYPRITLRPPPPLSTDGDDIVGSTNPCEELKSEDATVDLVTEITPGVIRNLLALF
jgi:hypothetical protein